MQGSQGGAFHLLLELVGHLRQPLPVTPDGQLTKRLAPLWLAGPAPLWADLIVAKGGRTQEQVLADFDARAKRPVKLTGVVPADQK